jgi:O-methyltransferase involved in polyketide biosynthesis
MRNDSVSATALLIAKSQLVLAHDPALSWAVGPDRARIYRACVSAALDREWTPAAATRAFYAIAERLSVPGIYLHYALRKLEIARIVDALIRQRGIGQVAVVAAGFDPLCALLHAAHPAVRWCELDHPATQRYKRAALATLPTGGNLTLLPIDLTRESIADLFRDGRLRRDVATLVIAEGITMYLGDDRIRAFFGAVRDGAAGRARHVLFTYMERQPNGSIHFRSSTPLVAWWLARTKESFVWGIEPQRLPPYLAELGFSLAGSWDAGRLRDEHLVPRQLADRTTAAGETIALATAGS